MNFAFFLANPQKKSCEPFAAQARHKTSHFRRDKQNFPVGKVQYSTYEIVFGVKHTLKYCISTYPLWIKTMSDRRTCAMVSDWWLISVSEPVTL